MRFLKRLFGIIPLRLAYAHCDIPCGVYDPTPAQIAAHTVLRMTNLILAATKEVGGVEREHKVARMTRVKEKHGYAVEEEIGTLENDYFKDEHYIAHPELKNLIHDAVKLSIKTRQEIDTNGTKELLEKVLQISEIFYKTKNVIPKRIKSLYPTEGEIVTYTE